MRIISIIFVLFLLVGCGPVNIPNTHQYQLNGLTGLSSQAQTVSRTPFTLLITRPTAGAGYQTSDMLYTDKHHQLNAFAQHSWAAPPADMLAPLLQQAIQKENYFYAVASTPYVGSTTFKLDTQLLTLRQIFWDKKSQVQVVILANLTSVSQNRLLQSQRFFIQVDAAPTPYGGVLAANKAISILANDIANFCVKYATQLRRLPRPSWR